MKSPSSEPGSPVAQEPIGWMYENETGRSFLWATQAYRRKDFQNAYTKETPLFAHPASPSVNAEAAAREIGEAIQQRFIYRISQSSDPQFNPTLVDNGDGTVRPWGTREIAAIIRKHSDAELRK